MVVGRPRMDCRYSALYSSIVVKGEFAHTFDGMMEVGNKTLDREDQMVDSHVDGEAKSSKLADVHLDVCESFFFVVLYRQE